MEGDAPDDTRDWLIPERSRPPLIGELVGKIEEAVAIARASEAAVMTVGEAALDAAQQARRAADLAERANAAVLDSLRPPPSPEPEGDKSLQDFHARADWVSSRLRALQRLPLMAEEGRDVESLR